MDCSPSGSSVDGILQARILEWVMISSSRSILSIHGWNQHLLRLLHWQVDSLHWAPLSPHPTYIYQIWLFKGKALQTAFFFFFFWFSSSLPQWMPSWGINIIGFFFLRFLNFYFLAVVSLCCCTWAFSSCGKWRLLSRYVCGLLIKWASHCSGQCLPGGAWTLAVWLQ